MLLAYAETKAQISCLVSGHRASDQHLCFRYKHVDSTVILYRVELGTKLSNYQMTWYEMVVTGYEMTKNGYEMTKMVRNDLGTK